MVVLGFDNLAAMLFDFRGRPRSQFVLCRIQSLFVERLDLALGVGRAKKQFTQLATLTAEAGKVYYFEAAVNVLGTANLVFATFTPGQLSDADGKYGLRPGSLLPRRSRNRRLLEFDSLRSAVSSKPAPIRCAEMTALESGWPIGPRFQPE